MIRRRALALALIAGLLGLPLWAQEIRHKATATTSPPRIGAAQWNASMAVTGGTNGQVFLRDSASADGWKFGTLTAAAGGTGLTTYVIGDLLTAATTTTLTRLASVADGSVLRSAGVGTAPLWGKVRLSGSPTDVTGTLPVANGGTGQFTYTVGDLLYADGSTSLALLADVATGNVLLAGGVGAAPSWGPVALTTHVSGILPGANGGTGNGFFEVAGPASSLKTFTFPNASTTVLTTNAAVTVAQGGTGVATLASNGVLYGNGTGVVLVTAQGGTNTVLAASAGAPAFSSSPTVSALTATGTIGAALIATDAALVGMGTGSGDAVVGGAYNTQTGTSATGADTTETDLWTVSLPASSLSANKKGIHVRTWGTVAANGNTKTLRLYFGATVVLTVVTTASGAAWDLDMQVIRTSATTQHAIGHGIVGTVTTTNFIEPNETNANAITVKVTGQNGTATASDIVGKSWVLDYRDG